MNRIIRILVLIVCVYLLYVLVINVARNVGSETLDAPVLSESVEAPLSPAALPGG